MLFLQVLIQSIAVIYTSTYCLFGKHILCLLCNNVALSSALNYFGKMKWLPEHQHTLESCCFGVQGQRDK